MKKKIPSAWPVYITAAFWLLYGLIFPIYLLKHLLVCACLSVAVFMLASKFIPGREVVLPVKTGNKELDRQIEKGRALLASLRSLNDKIPGEEVSACLSRMDTAGEQIFAVLEKDTSKANALRKFLNYYLPTTENLIQNYSELLDVKNPGANVQKAKSSVENSLSLVADAFEKQLDNLYGADALDITSDVDVLETMIAQEGLTKGMALKAIQKDTNQE